MSQTQRSEPPVAGYRVDVEPFGVAYIDSCGTNNQFWMGYGKPSPKSRHCYHMENVIMFRFESGEWAVTSHVQGFDRRERVHSVTPDLLAACARAALSVSELVDGLNRWRKDALKRLDKSVPRLFREYEDARDRQAALLSTTFEHKAE